MLFECPQLHLHGQHNSPSRHRQEGTFPRRRYGTTYRTNPDYVLPSSSVVVVVEDVVVVDEGGLSESTSVVVEEVLLVEVVLVEDVLVVVDVVDVVDVLVEELVVTAGDICA